ncbi:hypothetical protein Vadar_023100 [Vaccinium darrowii]|uniref:Uncharacterized protein n=1 Tax=Vaccinium darrowii TaxID=229202 RepID=A0ACB7ZKW9_9ERIC|nr:hypothetical protein Vadar_023100 [Vaccinium darrowii]
MQLNASRIKILQAQDDLVNAMKDSACKELLLVSKKKNPHKKLLKALIVEILSVEPLGLKTCLLQSVEFIKVEGAVNESVLEDAKREYAEKAQVKAPEVAIDKHVYLPPPPSSAESHKPSCSGEVVLASEDGKIVCENTLDAQLDVVFRQKLPEFASYRPLAFGTWVILAWTERAISSKETRHSSVLLKLAAVILLPLPSCYL